jgi:hemerythrin-like domain-containing protein
LILAQLLKRGAPVYKGLPVNNTGKTKYAQQQFDQIIKKHFEQEEAILEIAKYCHEDIRRLAGEITEEHMELTALFLSLDTSIDTEDTMDQLGRMLEGHIRKEERELFPLLEKYCPENLMQQIHNTLH